MNDPNIVSSAAFQRALHDELMRRSLADFHAAGFSMLHGGEKLVAAPHVEAMAHVLTRLAKGEIKRLIITLPPRHGKSELTSNSFVAWLLGHDPTAKITVASYGADLSVPLVDGARTIVKHPRYQRLFPDTRVRRDHDRAGFIKTTQGGSIRAASRLGAMTGLGTHYLISDDWQKAGEVISAIERENSIDTFRKTFLNRFDNLADGRMVIVQQRLHEEDLVGWALEHGDWYHLNLPGIAVQKQDIPLALGKVWQRKTGDLLCPAIAPQSVYDWWKQTMTPADYEAQVQQDPGSGGGGLVDWGWFSSYENRPPRTFFERVVQSIDLASSDATTRSSWSVGMTWGYRKGLWYLLDLFRVKEDFNEQVDRVLHWHRHWKADVLLIERASNGGPLYDLVKAARLPGLVRLPKPTVSKRARLEAATVHLRTGKFLLPENAEWLPALRRELLGFPDASSDDQVDALSQFVNWTFEKQDWIGAKRDANGRRMEVRRPTRKPRFYDGNLSSADSMHDSDD